MTREPLWRRRMRRPPWERDEVRLSDFDPLAPIHAAINRARLAQQRSLDRMAEMLDRLEEAQRVREAQAREERRRRLGR